VNPKRSSGRPWILRRKYLIDKPTQLRLSGWLLAGLIAIAAMYLLAMMVFLSPEALEGMESAAVRRLLLTANLAYFLFAAVLIVTLTVLLSHRFVGPARVFRLALEGMAQGDYGRRLTLRQTDYMKDVAAALSGVRQTWVERERQVAEAADRLERSLQRADADGARAALEALRSGRLVRTTEPAPAPAPAVAAPARETAAVPA
jgi:hypothetical protein